MTTQYRYAPELLQKLISASISLSPARKERILSRFDDITEAKRQRLFEILANEQTALYGINQRRIDANTAYLHRQTQIVNGYNETIGQINERSVVHQLDTELDSAFE